MDDLQTLLDAAVAYHGHMCAGQVLGVRMTVAGLSALGLDPQKDHRRIVAIVEIDRCAADAVSIVAGVSLGKRNLKLRDYGKMAATFLDLETRHAVRTTIRDGASERVGEYAPGMDRKQAEVIAYQRMPIESLVDVREVRVLLSDLELPGSPRRSAVCETCGEKIRDGREVMHSGRVSCRPCAGESYYEALGDVDERPAGGTGPA